MFKSDFGRLVIFLLIRNVFSLPFDKLHEHISTTLIMKTTTKKSFVCPWYCYPIGIFSSLILLILLTTCVSACDYRYLKKHQNLKIIEQKPNPIENKTISIISEKASLESDVNDDDDDGISVTSAESNNI
ncbi:hypothetical protein I4U23_019312 [Adineta vaga]|nr:hypothetical protein I4U23_019312 [Adineta vaga]